jgi:ABC-2 type transport system ATP-binding protein
LAIEDGSFYEKLTVEENLLHFGRLYGVDEKLLNERIGELLDFVGLKDAKKTVAENLSIGMKKRLDFSCSLIHNPAILVLDEPTADLDPLLRKQMLSLIKHINSLGTTVIMTTQLLEEAEEFCEKVLILSNDKIVEADSPSKIIKKYGCSNLNQVFNKIFVNKGRKVNRNFLKKKKAVKKKGSVNTLKFNKKEFENLIEEASEKKKSKSILEDLE